MDFSDFAKEHPNLPSDSEESDEDYVPTGADSSSDYGSDVQAVDSGGDGTASDAEGQPAGSKRKHSKRPATTSKRKKRSASGRGARKGKKQEETQQQQEEEEEKTEESPQVTEVEEKKKADSLWEDFKSQGSKVQPNETLTNGAEQPAGSSTVTVTQVYEFAGEEVSVQKKVAADSAQARLGRGRGTASHARGGLKGLSSVLGQLGRKPKIGTLEKSKLDWDRFKQQEGIEEDIRTFNRGKDGFLERQDFLQRTDVRQFEIERALRTSRRSNR